MEEFVPTTNRLIRASAGTGKTFQLSNRYLDLLIRGAAPDAILATTFTRKAAGEILDRVVLRLAEAASDPAKRADLANKLGVASLDHEQVSQLLRRVVGNLHRLRICTLDSFFSQLARGLSLELDLSPHWRILDDWEEDLLRERGLDEMLQAGSTQRLHTLAGLLSKGEARRGVAELLRQVVQDLHETFLETEKAAWHGLRITPPLAPADLDAACCVLAEVDLPSGQAATRNADLDRLRAEDWQNFLKLGLAGKIASGTPVFRNKPIDPETIVAYEPLLAHAKAVLIARLAQQTQASFRLLQEFHSAYSRLKSESGQVRFQDLTFAVAQMVDRFTDAAGHHERLAFRLDGVVQHVLLDEFQDTSPIQWRALRGLVHEVASDQRPDGSVFCVGDAKQAIYGWRGGVAEIFDAIEGELPAMQVDTMEKSYRSSPVVIDTVNRVFRGIPRHTNLERYEDAVRSWCDRFPEHSTDCAERVGYCCLRTSSPQSSVSAASAELETATQVVAELVAEAAHVSVGVLVRTNACVGQLIYLLRRAGIYASEEGGNPLTDSASVGLILSTLWLADHPGDLRARFHVARSPLGPALGLSDFRDDLQAGKTSRTLRRQLLEDGYSACLQHWVQRLIPHVGTRDRNRLQQLVELATRFEAHATSRPSEFVAYVERQRVADPTSANVRVMTIHQAKGLEFDAVVLPELHGELVGQPKNYVVRRPHPTAYVDLVCSYTNASLQRLLPDRFRKTFAEHHDHQVIESLCLLYVALTRAKRALYMVIPPSPTKEAKLPKRFSGLLRAALADEGPAAADSVLYEAGVSDWYRHTENSLPSEETIPVATQTAPLEPPSGRVHFAPGRSASRSLVRISPSQLEGGGTLRIDAIVRRQAQAGMQWGSLVHAFFECVGWLEDGVPTDQELEESARQLDPPVSCGAEELAQFRELLEKESVAGVLRRDYYRKQMIPLEAAATEFEARCEFPFAAVQDGQLVTGFVDRLVLMRRAGRIVAADVVDFKTDGGDIEERLAFYAPQIEAYRKAVAKAAGLELASVSARLLFVSQGVVRTIG